MFLKYRSVIISLFFVLAIVSTYFSTQLKFSFSFEQFFPKGDPDLEFYKNFTKDFEADDNFLLIAVEHHPTVFDSAFLSEFHTLSLQLRDIPLITKVQSLTQVEYPVRTPFGYTMIPLIHLESPWLYQSDRTAILKDERYVYNLIDSSATSLVIAAKTFSKT